MRENAHSAFCKIPANWMYYFVATSYSVSGELFVAVIIDIRCLRTGLETDHVLSLATNNRGALTAE